MERVGSFELVVFGLVGNHVEGVFVVPREYLPFELVKILAVVGVLALPPGGSAFPVLEAPVYRERRGQHEEFVTSYVHLVHLK